MVLVSVMRVLGLAALTAVAFTAAGCSSFNRKWREAERSGASASGMAGRWEGKWQSSVNGHSGRLRCLISGVDDGLYDARYQARYWGFLTFHYTVPLRTSQSEPPFHFNGQANLGWWAGGVYHYEGVVDTNSFISSYSSKADKGEFRMSRR